MNPVALIGVGLGLLLKSASAYAQRAEGFAMTQDERTQAILKLAAERNIPPAVALAIFTIESGNTGFSNGRMVIRFEPGYYKKFAGQSIDVKRGGQSAEWDNFTRASAIDPEAAMKSISMGSSQIMGANFKMIGYPTVKAMFDAFSTDENAHIRGFFDFVRAAGIEDAARAGDWTTFARKYNGPAQKGYDSKMAAQYASYVKKGFGGIA